MFKIFRKKEEKAMPTLEEVKQAYSGLADEDKEAFKRSLTTPDQENAHKQEPSEEPSVEPKDEQPEEAREEESPTEEPSEAHEEETREDETKEGEEEPGEEKKEDAEKGALAQILERLGNIEADIAAIKSGNGKEVRPASSEDSEKLSRIASIYNS